MRVPCKNNTMRVPCKDKKSWKEKLISTWTQPSSAGFTDATMSFNPAVSGTKQDSRNAYGVCIQHSEPTNLITDTMSWDFFNSVTLKKCTYWDQTVEPADRQAAPRGLPGENSLGTPQSFDTFPRIECGVLRPGMCPRRRTRSRTCQIKGLKGGWTSFY